MFSFNEILYFLGCFLLMKYFIFWGDLTEISATGGNAEVLLGAMQKRMHINPIPVGKHNFKLDKHFIGYFDPYAYLYILNN